MNSKFVFIAILFSLILGSCEYPLEDENYIEIKPPSDYIEIYIETINPGDTILVIEPVKFHYSLYLPDKKFDGAVFRLQSKEWHLDEPSGFIIIDPKEFISANSTLELLFQYATGSGSIADQLGLEGYGSKLEWNLIIEGRRGPQLKLDYKINSDGLLEFFWEPNTRLNFDYYYLKISSPSTSRYNFQEIYNPEITSYIDSCFTGRAVSATIEVIAKGYEEDGFLQGINIEYDTLEFKFEFNGNDSLRFYWDKSEVARRYSFIVQNNSGTYYYLEGSTDTFIVVPRPAFAQTTRYILTEEPYFLDICKKNNWWSYPNLSKTILFTPTVDLPGVPVTADFPSSNIEYSRNENIYFWKHDSEINVLDTDSLYPIRKIDIGNLGSPVSISSDVNSSRFAIGCKDYIYLFSDQYDESPEIFYTPSHWNLVNLTITNSNLIALKKAHFFTIFDTKSKKIIHEEIVGGNRMSISVDGKYLSNCNLRNYIKISEIHSTGLTSVYEFVGDVSNAYFNPLNPKQLLISRNQSSVIDVMSIPELEIVKSIYMEKPVNINNIDPYTGLLLTTDIERSDGIYRHYIIDIESGVTKYSLFSVDPQTQLYKNKLLTARGFYLDLSENLN